jgi:prepilin-type N-terminal cleavage/methylation domain-containing protein
MRNRRGWTMIELLVVIVVIGALASISVLKYIDLTRTALTSRIVGDFVTVRLAAYNYEADHPNLWPPDQGPGVTPPELVPYLPDGFDFTNPNYELDWDNLAGGGPYLVGVKMLTADPRLMNSVIQTLGSKAPYFVAGNTLTYVLIDPSGNY